MSLKLIKSSLLVLKQDKEMLFYPLFSFITLLALWASFAYITYTTGLVSNVIDNAAADSGNSNPVLIITLLVFYFCNYFVITYFNTALVSSALIRFEGGNPSLNDGFKIASSRIKYILAWSLLAATISLTLKIIEKRSNSVQEIVASFLGLTWGVCSYLVIPFFIKEQLYPISALKKSAQLINRTWSAALVAEIGLGFLGFLLFLLGFSILWLFPKGEFYVYVFPTMVGYWSILWLISSALSGIVVAGVYTYGVTSKVPHGFAEDNLLEAFHK